MNDVDLSSVCGEELGISWDPIGTTGETTGIEFAGIFDGNYHTIDNLYIDSSTYEYEGLFYGNTATGIIQNIILSNVYIYNKYSSRTTFRWNPRKE